MVSWYLKICDLLYAIGQSVKEMSFPLKEKVPITMRPLFSSQKNQCSTATCPLLANVCLFEIKEQEPLYLHAIPHQ